MVSTVQERCRVLAEGQGHLVDLQTAAEECLFGVVGTWREGEKSRQERVWRLERDVELGLEETTF